MVAFVLGSIMLMVIGWFGLKISVINDVQAKRRMTVRWYDMILTVFMVTGAVCSCWGLIVLAWRLLP